MSDILSNILSTKVLEVTARSQSVPLSKLREQCAEVDPTRGFVNSLSLSIDNNIPGVICEIKKASPSKGVIREDFDPELIAANYAEHDATCLSILTDEKYFQGHDTYIDQAKSVCSIPVIRKDFIIDPYQVFESRVIGADAILLIVAALGDATLIELSELAHDLELDVLIEVHNKDELHRALRVPGKLIGINNRDLHTFDTSLNTTIDLLDQIPEDKIVITESGIHTRDDVELMRSHGVNGFLVGEAFMRERHPGEMLRALFG